MLDKLDWADFVLLICTETYYRRFRGHEEPGTGKGVDWEGQLITLELYQAKSRTTKFVPVIFASQNEEFIPEPLRDHPYRLDSEDSYRELYAFLTGQAGVPLPELGVAKTLPRNEIEPMRFESSKEQGRSMGKLNGVPDLPPHYLPREEDIAGLKQKLLAGDGNVGITGQSSAVGVQGMSGIGKTVLATALAHDPEVRKAFPEGIFWLTVGQKPNLLLLQGKLLRQLTGVQPTFVTTEEGKDALRKAFEGWRVLVMLDDVWTFDDADALSVTASIARLLLTTRNQDVLVGIAAEEHRVDVLSPGDAAKMLAEWTGNENPDLLPPEAAKVAKECGYLPLALAMVGAMIRRSKQPPAIAWQDALDCLRASDLEEIKRSFPGYPYPDLLRAIEVSVEALDESDRERYLDLAVFPEDQPIPETTLRVLWKLDARRTRKCMDAFTERSLATIAAEAPSAGVTSTLNLHDLQRDLIRKRREKDLPGLHLRLVEAWDALPKLPDAYAWRWVGYHMVEAGRKDDLRRLLLNFNYLQANLTATDTNALIADYDYLANEEELRLIQSALRLSANVLARDARQLAGQLIGRLLSNTSPSIQAFLKQAAERKVWPWLRPLNPILNPPGGSLIRILRAHTKSVRAVAVTSDGRRLVSASDDCTLRVWDLESGQILRTLEGHQAEVYGLAIAPDGRRAVSASMDQTLRLWDLESGQTIRTLEGHADGAFAVAITPDGCRAVSASADRTLKVWDLKSGHPLLTLIGHTDGVLAAAVTPDGLRVVSGSNDRTLLVWDLKSGQIQHTLEGHKKAVTAVAIAPDSRRAVSASDDWTVRVWNLDSGEMQCALEGHRLEVRGVAVTHDGRLAISASRDRTLRLWNLDNGYMVRMLEGTTGTVQAVAVTPDGRRAVSASSHRTLRVWDLYSHEMPKTVEGHTASVWTVAVTPDGKRAISGSNDRTLRVWDLRSGETVRTLVGHEDEVWAVAVTPDGKGVISASKDQTLRLWDLESGQTLRTLNGHTDTISSVVVTCDGRRAVTGGRDRTLRVWDLESGQTLRILEGHTDSVTAVAVTPNGRRAVSASVDRTLRLWDLENGQTLRILEGHTDSVTAVAITPDGCYAVSASGDRTLRTWDLESGQFVRKLEGHTDWVQSVAVAPNSQLVASGSYDDTIRVWELRSGEGITTFTGEGRIYSCTVTPDGRTIVAGGQAGRVHFLRVVEADPTKPPIGDAKIQLLHPGEQPTKKPQEPPIMLPAQTRAVFISYAHVDKERWLDRFVEFFRPLVRQEDFTLCSDQDIKIGQNWHQHIQAHLNGAKAVVLLISPAFLASDYIANSELPVILKNAADHGVQIFPILISPSLFTKAKYKYPDPKTGPQEFTLASLQAANSPSKTLVEMTEGEQNRVLLEVADQLAELLSENPQ